jgi:hypothetical protein
MGRVAPGSGQVTVVVEPGDSVELVRSLGPACRRSGRFVGHTSPKHFQAWRFQIEVLAALGKHWDRAAPDTHRARRAYR